MKKWLISTAICIMVYIPWLTIVYKQASSVVTEYWINPITVNTVISYIYYIFSPAFQAIRGNELVPPTILGTLLFICLIYLFYRNKDDFTTNALLIFILVPLIGIILSLIKQPIFHARYFIPSLGCLWLIFSILLAKSFKNIKIFIPVIFLILIIGVMGIFAYVPLHEIDVTNTEIEYTYLSNIGSNNVIISNYQFHPAIFKYYVPNNYQFTFNPNEINLVDLLNNPKIINYKNNGSKIYYIDNIDVNETYKNLGLNFVEIPINQSTLGYKIYEIIY